MIKLRTVVVVLAAVAVVFLMLYGMAPLLASTDVRRLAQERKPLFCWSRWVGYESAYLDGGSEIFHGFGYEVVAKHRIIEAHRFDTGIVVSFTLPWYRRFDSETFVERTE